MRLFLDTANIDEIREVARMGVLSGVTTNPTLMAKERGVEYRDRVVEICEVVKGPVSAECIARDVPGHHHRSERDRRLAPGCRRQDPYRCGGPRSYR